MAGDMDARRGDAAKFQAVSLIDQYGASACEVARSLRRQHVEDSEKHQFWSAVVRNIQKGIKAAPKGSRSG
jgi:hypothetical protein